MRQFLLVASFFAFTFGLHAQVLLFDQTGNAGTGALASQDFETANDAYDCEIAEDFRVPATQTWYIDSIKLFGQYSATNVPTAGIKMKIYQNNNGSFGTLLFDTVITVDTDPDNNGSLNAHFAEPLILPADTYWIVASARKDFANGGGQWYWGRETTGFGANFMWQNTNNGFATGCSTWVAATACSALGVSDPGVRFRIWGCYGVKPVVELPGDTVLCSDFIPVTIGPSNILSNTIYYWNTGDTADSLEITTTGTYTLYAYNPTTQCAGVDEVEITVHPTPHANLENDTICQGQTATFNGFANCGTCQYAWNGTVGTAFYSTGTAGWHHLVITNPNSGCVGHDSAWLEVQSTDPPVVAPNAENFMCEGDTLYVYVVDPYFSYAWSTGATSQGIYVTQTGQYVVTVSTSNGCQSTSDTVYVTTQTPPTPTISVDYTVNWKTRLSAPAGYQSYLWSTGSTEIAIIANASGTFSLTVTDEFGCEGVVSLYVEVTGISELLANKLQVYPNPAKDKLNVVWPAEWVGNSSMELSDLSGRVLRFIQASETQQSIDVNDLSGGHYLLRVYTPSGQGAMHIHVE